MGGSIMTDNVPTPIGEVTTSNVTAHIILIDPKISENIDQTRFSLHELDDNGEPVNTVEWKYFEGLVLDKYYNESVLLSYANKKMGFAVSYNINGMESNEALIMRADLDNLNKPDSSATVYDENNLKFSIKLTENNKNNQ